MKGTPDVSRLPMWAQRRIEHLESDVRRLEALLDETAGVATEEPGTVSYGDWRQHDRPIPRDHKITFHFAPVRGQIPSRIQVRHDDDSLYVSGSDVIAVHPVAGNVVRIRTTG